MAKLYPPNIAGTIPAFYSVGATTNIVVPFSMNKAVGKSEVFGFSLKIKHVDGNVIDTFQVFKADVTLLENGTTYNVVSASYDIEKELIVTFNVNSIKEKYLKEGQYYKIQLAYIDSDLTIGYYSTVGIIKYTIRPTVTIANLNLDSVNAHQYAYIGVYSQYRRDPTEKVYSSRFVLTDNSGSILKDTGYMLHNTSEDDLPYESRESFLFSRDLDSNTVYYLTYSVKTMNGLELSSPRYRISQLRSIGTEVDLSLKANLNYENGYIKLGITCKNSYIKSNNLLEKDFVENKYYVFNKDINDYILATSWLDNTIYYLKQSNEVISGTFLISKACSKDDYQWTEIKRFDVQSMIPDEWFYIDCTIEQGYFYKYSLQQYNANDIYSERVLSNEVYADFEHAFLYDGKQQFKMSYDPKVNNFKNNILENKIDTIGNKYPFIVRNGNVNYKSFDIQGLISFQSDDEGLFLSTDNYDTDDIVTDLTSQNIAAERYFKRNLQDWLNNGTPKLFRSPMEGNFIVRLLNVALTPEDKLGRMLHSFKATAYEIGSFDSENLERFGIVDSTENLSTLTRWVSIDLKEFSQNQTGWRSINASRTVYSIKIQDCMPGTVFRIDGQEIMIGATGSYIAESLDGFSNVEINTSDFNNRTDLYSYPLITYSYQTKAVSIFGSITNVSVEDIPLEQYIGTSAGTNILATLNDAQSTVSALGLIRFKKRDLYQVYVDCPTPNNFNPKQNWTYYEDQDLTKQINLDQLSKLGIYQIRCKRSDYRDYFQEGYYTDKIMDQLAPFTDYFLDGNTHEVSPITNSLFRIILNESEQIDLSNIEKYSVTDITAVSSVIINQGVIAEISYSRQISTYHFENNDYTNSLNTAINGWKASKDNFNTILESQINNIGNMSDTIKINYLKELDNQTSQIKSKYSLSLNFLNSAIAQYREREGLV